MELFQQPAVQTDGTLPDSLKDMTDEQYFAHRAISNSDLVVLATKGLKYFYHYKYDAFFDGKLHHDSLVFGSLIHCLLLEPQEYAHRYVSFQGEKPKSAEAHSFCALIVEDNTPNQAFAASYSTKNKSDQKVQEEATKKYNDYCDWINCLLSAKGKTFIEYEDIEKAKAIIRQYTFHPIAQGLKQLEDRADAGDKSVVVLKEKVLMWTDPETGLECKAKLDMLVIDHNKQEVLLPDYKTTAKIGPHEFANACHLYRYDRQGAYYLRGLELSGLLEELGVTAAYSRKHIILALGTQAPFVIDDYTFEPEVYEEAAKEIERDLRIVKSKIDFQDDPKAWNDWCNREPNTHATIGFGQDGKFCIK